MVPSKRDEVHGAQAAAMTSRKKSAAVNCRASAQAVSCRAGGAHYEKKKKLRKASLASGVQDPQARGGRPPCMGAQEVLVRGMG